MPGIFDHSIPLVILLLVLLLAARVMGEIMERLHQPALIGEVLAGIILGPSLLGLVAPSPELKVISDLGVFLLVIVAGMDVQPEDVRNSIKGKSIWIAILGFIVPILSGLIIGWVFHLDIMLTVFLSLCIAITALPVSIRVLMDLGKLNTDIGRKIISAAVFNDIVSLLVLGIILDIKSNFNNITEMTYSVGITIIKIVLLVIILATVYKLFQLARQNVVFVKKKFELFIGFMHGKESLFAIVILFVLIFASLTELVGLHFVVGAFFAALFLSKDILGLRNFVKVRNNTNVITMGFLAPIFFAGIGVQFNFGAINNFMLLLIVLLASVLSKLIGGYFGGRLAGLGKYESIALGVGLNSRGIIELVIANIALNNGFIDRSLFSILVIMGLFTTLISPYFLKKSFTLIDKKNQPCSV